MLVENGRLLVTIYLAEKVECKYTPLCFKAPESIKIIRGKAKKKARMPECTK